jgi:hypothetical protein
MCSQCESLDTYGLHLRLKRVNDAYVTDAYHSLSIEDTGSRPLSSNASAAALESGSQRGRLRTTERHRGATLWQAFQAVQKRVDKILKGESRRVPVLMSLPNKSRSMLITLAATGDHGEGIRYC